MDEKKAVEERNMDRRLVDRNLEKGIISQADIEAYDGSLEDVSDNLEVVKIDAEGEETKQAPSDDQTAAAPAENNSGSASVTSISSTQGGA